MEMNYCGASADSGHYCYFHPGDVVVGVCAACLKERLLILSAASKQGRVSADKLVDARIIRPSCRASRRRSGRISLPKVFALGSFLHRLDSRRRHRRPDHDDDHSSDDPESIPSLEDSFISIKFEDNGNARWDSKKPPPPPIMVRLASSNDGGGGGGGASGGKEMKEGIRSIVEHAKKGGVLRWRKRIGHLLQLARWKRPGKAAAGHAGVGSSAKMEGSGVKGRKLRLDQDSNNYLQDQDQDQDQDHRYHRHHRHHHK